MTQQLPPDVSKAAETWYACCALALKFPAADIQRQQILQAWCGELTEKLTALGAQIARPATELSPFTIYWKEVAVPVTARHQFVEGDLAHALATQLSMKPR